MDSFLLNFNLLYLIAIVMALFLVVKLDIQKKHNKFFDNLIVFIIVLGVLYLFGFRGEDIGADTWNYIFIYDKLASINSFSEAIEGIKGDYLFYYFTFISSRFFNSQIFLFLLSLLYIIPLITFIYRISKVNRSLLLIVFLSFFFFMSMGINVLRSGIAISFALLSLSYPMNGYVSKKNLFLLVACMFHLSALIIFIAFFVAKRVQNIRYLYLLLFLSSILAYLEFGLNNLPLISYITSFERISVYSNVDNSLYQTGFRWGFWIFNMFFIIYFYCVKKMSISIDEFHYNIIKVFIILSSFFFLCFNLPYSDRFGLLSWSFIPILLYYPFRYKLDFYFQHITLLFLLVGFKLFSVLISSSI